MKKWTWLTVPVAVVGLALGFWGGVVFAQEPTNSPVPVALSGNGTEMADYCRSAGGMGGMGGMMGAGNMTGQMGAMMGDGGMMGGGGMMGR